MTDLSIVCDQFPIGTGLEILPIHIGLIHQTYKIVSSSGAYCLQKIHKVLSHEGVFIDYERVTEHLLANGFPSPKMVRTKADELVYTDEEGNYWRCISWLPGNSRDAISETSQLERTAEFLGSFHDTMSSYPFEFCSPHKLHQTEFHLNNLNDALGAYEGSNWYQRVEEEVSTLLKLMPNLHQQEFPQRVIHGDPKITNFLFLEDNRVSALIDLDTCNRHTILVELGDAIRSWCGKKHDKFHCSLDMDYFSAAMRGYLRSPFAITKQESEAIPMASMWICLELSARFFEDVLRDSYFAWDDKEFASRSEHNFSRGKQMLSLAQDISSRLSEMEGQIKRFISSSH